jgi:hypothetical protein
MNNLGLGSEKLIRNLSIEYRKLYREETLKNYKVQTNKSLTGKEIILIVEWIEGGFWGNKPLIVKDNIEIGKLINSKKFKKNENESINFCTAKGQKMLTPMMKMDDIYDKYHDRDDRMVYLRLIRENSF